MSKRFHFLTEQRLGLVRASIDLMENAGERALTEDEQARDDKIAADIEALDKEIAREERAREFERNTPAVVPAVGQLNLPRGDTFGGAFTHWLKTGDKGGLMAVDNFSPVEQPAAPNGVGDGYTVYGASNPTDMNIGTAADGGNLVPTGFYNNIVAKRDETMLAAKLPIMRVPGVGTTVEVPYDNEADGEFVVTTEAATFDEDAPALGKKSLTLALYSKYTDVSYQLLEDTPTNLLGFLSNFVGRGMAKTHNNLLITEVGSNGTNFKTFAGAAAIAFGEPEDIVGNNDLADYLEDDNAAVWVTRSSTHWDIKSLVGSDRQYAINVDAGRSLLGYPVLYSQKVAAMTTGNKSIYFGNWQYVAMREAPGITFIRDPYTVAVSGQVRLLWHFRTVYGVLQAEAIGYGTQA